MPELNQQTSARAPGLNFQSLFEKHFPFLFCFSVHFIDMHVSLKELPGLQIMSRGHLSGHTANMIAETSLKHI